MSKSYREQLSSALKQQEALAARIVELTEKAANEFDYSLVQPGARVEAMFGRAEKKRTVMGVVLGRKSQDKGGSDLVRVQTDGDAFTSEILTVFITNVTGVFDADGNRLGAPAPEVEAADTDPLAG
jgi:hypothetical protein